jgi:hypothetical protein
MPLVITLLLVLAQWVLLAGLTLAKSNAAAGEGISQNAGHSISPAALIAVGPFLFLQVLILQNIARTAALIGWTLPAAFGWTLLAGLEQAAGE